MGDELTRSLTMLAERGETRGADAVLEDARRVTTPQPAPVARRRGGLAVAVGAAAIVLLFVGLFVWLVHPFDGTDQPPVITQPEAPVLIESGGFSWRSAPLPRELRDIAVLDGSYLAVSTHSGPSGVFSEVVVSTNGLDWVPLTSQPAWMGDFDAAQIERDGIAYPAAFVEYGDEVWSVTADQSDQSNAMPVVEHLLKPNRAWTQVPVEAVSGLNNNQVVFAAGGAGAIMFAGGRDGEAFLWVLGDNGLELVDDPLIDALPVAADDVPWTDAGLAGYLRATRLLATDGGFEAQFWIANDRGVTTDSSLRYRSTDGRSWTKDPGTLTDGGDFVAWDQAEYNGRTLAVGGDGVWISDAGGTTWTQTQTPEQLTTELVAAGPLGWVVPAGQAGMGFEPRGIWISSDGSNWKRCLISTPESRDSPSVRPRSSSPLAAASKPAPSRSGSARSPRAPSEILKTGGHFMRTDRSTGLGERPLVRRRVSVLVALAVAVSGCGGAESSEPTVAPVSSTVAQSSSTTSTVAPSSSTEAAVDVLVYVAMGDSVAFSPPQPDGLIWRYQAMLADHFGTEVDLRNRAIGSLHSTVMLERLRNHAGLRADLAEADVVTTDIPVNVWVEALQTVGGWQGRDPAECGGDDGQQCLRDALDHYKADTDAIIDEIVAICDPEEVLIRLYDVYALNPTHNLDSLQITNPYWRAGMDYVEESAARYGIPVAQVYDAFMGPDGIDDPYLKGLYGEDHLHPNADGAAVIADLLDGFGY